MRTALLAFLLAITSQSVRAATAYEALRTVGKQRGEATLDKVTELRGERGAPQPREWRIITKDPASRSGVREFAVQGTRLVGEKAPATRATGSPLNISQLNLDSDGAHQIAEREAKKVTFAYDHADYVLRAGTHGGAPVWEVRLVDNQTGDTATITMAATTGKILSSEGLVRRRATVIAQPPVVRERPGQLEEADYPAPDERSDRPPQAGAPPLGIRVNNWFDRAGKYLGRRFSQAGDAVGSVFTGGRRGDAGTRDSSRNRDDDYERAPRRNSIDEDYTRPTRIRD
ncbi:MAG: hypothetical protein ABMA01_07415 [Chthoniobacteraceae bacterium]